MFERYNYYEVLNTEQPRILRQQVGKHKIYEYAEKSWSVIEPEIWKTLKLSWTSKESAKLIMKRIDSGICVNTGVTNSVAALS